MPKPGKDVSDPPSFKNIAIAQSTSVATPPWLLKHPVVDFRLHYSDKDTPPDIFKCHFFTNCVTATVTNMAYTQTVLKLVTEIKPSVFDSEHCKHLHG